jgi:hypothetical protein
LWQAGAWIKVLTYAFSIKNIPSMADSKCWQTSALWAKSEWRPDFVWSFIQAWFFYFLNSWEKNQRENNTL